MNISARRLVFTGFSFWIVVAAAAIFFLWPLREKLRFGIDLVGGTYITLEVQVDKAVESELISLMQSLGEKFSKARQAVPISQIVDKEKLTLILTFADNEQASSAASLLKQKERDIIVSQHEASITIAFTDARANLIRETAVRSNIEVLRTRLDKFSVAEIAIAAQGDKNIIVELPDVADPAQAKAMIGKAALLEFKTVEKVGSSEDEILADYDGILPDGMEILPGKSGASRSYESTYYLVSAYTDVTGKLLRDAYPGLGGETGAEIVVYFKFNAEGDEKFYELTKRGINKPLAIVLDNEVIQAPQVLRPIRGQGYITGMTGEEANELAMLLKSGAFVAPVTFEEERQIGPSLGAASIKQGLMSCLAGLALLFLFSITLYKIPGIFAFMTLLYNLLLILLALAWLKATLTLPGIAGMVLTVGMAIDASILIYERIKEELAAGVGLRKAINNGFTDAQVVILDANVTNLIVGVVLYKFGTGPIQGFAVTMVIGIIATLITGLFFLRSLLNFVVNAFNIETLKF